MLVISSMSNSFQQQLFSVLKCPNMMTRHCPRSSRTLGWPHSRGMRPQPPVGKMRTMGPTVPNIRNFSSFSTILPLLPHSCWCPCCYSSLWIVLCSVSLTFSTIGCPKTLLTCGVIWFYDLECVFILGQSSATVKQVLTLVSNHCESLCNCFTFFWVLRHPQQSHNDWWLPAVSLQGGSVHLCNYMYPTYFVWIGGGAKSMGFPFKIIDLGWCWCLSFQEISIYGFT